VASLLVAGTLALAWDASAQEPVTSRFKLSIGGYIKAEMMYRTNNGGVALGGSIPGTQNFGFGGVPQKDTIAGKNGQFDAFTNESRFAFTINAPDWRGMKSLGYLEFDFDNDEAQTFARFCQSNAFNGASPCAAAQTATNSRTNIQNGAFRIRHAFMRLSGEGLGGSWSVTLGQTWNTIGMLPFYGGSSFSFGGATVFGGRTPQLTLRHDLNLFRDLTWQSTISANNDTTSFNEMPTFAMSGRAIYRGWQGWQGGVRTPVNAGISTWISREKADLNNLAAGVVGTESAPGVRSLSATAWGLTGGIFLPILPGRSATDRTWALSVVSEAGYGEGVTGQHSVGANPIPGVSPGANNRADIGSIFFKPSSCNAFLNGPTFPGGTLTTAGMTNPCPAGMIPTELSLVKQSWTSYNVQFYLPMGFWLAGGQKWLWFSNADNAVAQTCINGATAAACTNAATGLVTPVVQGRWNDATGAAVNNIATVLNGSRDALIKRLSYSYISAFYDMTPNIRLGFEWGVHDAARKDSNQDNQSHRWQFGAYYFF
jgi:hypothetical protein